MTTQTVSVVVVSRNRPNDLHNCLLALTFQTLPKFEVIVVGDKAIPAVLDRLGMQDSVTFLPFDTPNISRARNIGISAANGDVIAFIDDDAVAEPTWLARLSSPFDDPQVAASGGFVKARNGISFQWKAQTARRTGNTESLDVVETTILEGNEGKAIKTHGTNCAFRKTSLIALGGFDENFHFYLDETDLNIRVAQAGLLTAVVPFAQVQHGFSPSARRTKNRAPLSLFDEGASQAYFLKKHGQDLKTFEAFAAQQRKRLLRHVVRGDLEPRDVAKLISTLQNGYRDGLERRPIQSETAATPKDFKRFSNSKITDHVFLAGHRLKKKKLFADAKDRAAKGTPITVLILSYTTLFHHRWFHSDGFWVQSGGIFGKSYRSDRLFKPYRMRGRVLREMNSLEKTRYVHSSVLYH